MEFMPRLLAATSEVASTEGAAAVIVTVPAEDKSFLDLPESLVASRVRDSATSGGGGGGGGGMALGMLAGAFGGSAA